MDTARVNINGVPQSIRLNASFNPYEQAFTLIAPDGKTSFDSSLPQVQLLMHNVATQGVIYGTQCGASILMAVLLLLMTRKDKRRSWVFAFNTSALIFDAIRSILQCAQLNGAFYDFYNFEAMFYIGPGVRAAQKVSACAALFTLFTIICIEASLVFQVRIVCVTMARSRRSTVTLGSIVVAMIAIGFRFALTVININQTINIGQSSVAKLDYLNWIASSANITLVTSIAFFSLIFCVKLAYAIMSRHKLGMKQFGPMQIIFVMGCQTLIIPLFFAIITYYCIPNTQINSFVSTIVAIFLPLSGMWASAAFSEKSVLGRNVHALPFDPSTPVKSRGTNNTSGSTDKQPLTSYTPDTIDTLIGGTNNSSVSSSPLKMMNPRSGTTAGKRTFNAAARNSMISEVDVDLEMREVLGGGKNIHVDRTYSVQSDRGRH